MPLSSSARPAKKRTRPQTGTTPTTSSQQDSDTSGGSEDALQELARLPGFGPRLIEKAQQTLGSPQAVLTALTEGDTEALTRTPGISPRLAQRLIHQAQGTDPTGFFGTQRAARLFEDFQQLLLSGACTRAGRNRLRLLAPHGDPEQRARRLEWCQDASREAATLDLEEARRNLRQLDRLPTIPPSYEADVLLLFDNDAHMQSAREAGLHRWAPLAHTGENRLLERVQEATLVMHASRDPSARPYELEQADHLITLPAILDPIRLIPWATIQRYEKGRKALEAAARLSRLRDRPSPSQNALELLADHTGTPRPLNAHDIETRAQVILEEELAEAEKQLEQLTLTGNELMRALRQEVPDTVTQVYQQATRRASDRLEQETGLQIDAYTDTTPPHVEPKAIHKTASRAAQTAARKTKLREQELAQQLAELTPAVEEEITDHEAFDARQAIGSLWNDHKMTAPQWGPGLLIQGLRPLHLHTDTDTDSKIEPVDYRIGITADHKSDDIQIALLTGANSGGKTTLLEGLTLLVTLAHAGLGVPAQHATLPELDSVHLYAPSRDRSAGALESLLLDLFPLTQQPGRRLVLADELEAITELEAACEILAALLEGLIDQGTHAVLATHLAPQLLPSLSEKARRHTRIDGIEAHGLDENGRLQVTRSPRLDHLARSTPELILRRLANHGPPDLAPSFHQLAERVRSRLENSKE